MLWTQHFPCDLLVQKSFADAIQAHRGSVEVTCDWDVISKVLPLVFFHLDPERGASFYDLVVWYLGWVVPLAAAEDDDAAIGISLLLCAYLLPQTIPV